MVDLVLKAEQIRSAPREVREWIRAVVLAELALAPGPERREDETAEPPLAECTVEEANLVLEHIRDDYLATQVFFELGRDGAHQFPGSPELYRIPVIDILNHTRLGSSEHLAACLDRIVEAFQAVRRDPTAIVPPPVFETPDCDYAASGGLSIWSRRNWAGERWPWRSISQFSL
jgi:hypothetical protein